MIGLNKIWLNQVQLNRLYLNAPFPVYRKMTGGGSSGDGFPVLPGDVTRWHFGGLTNAMMAAMDDPRLEDADGKGRFLSFKNFAWGGMSGAGGYNQNFNQWGYGNLSTATQTHTSYKIELSVPSTLKTANIYSNANSIGKEGDIYDFTLNIVGLKDGASLRITKGVVSGVIEMIEKDGIYKIYQPIEAGWDQSRIYIFISNPNLIDLNITIEQLPLYPGALVFDGVDDYGTCDNFPILTKEKGYTVVALRSIIDKNIPGYLLSNSAGPNQGAFIFERTIDSLTASFGKSSPITVNYNNPLTYQTTSKYNQKSISVGELLEGGKSLVVGRNSKEGNLYANAAIWELVFLDHDATEEELTKIKDYFVKTYPWLFPDQAWTVVGKTNEDEDRATIANITGNGNDLVLSNVAFSENSGYGSYPFGMNVWNPDYIADQPYGTVHYPNDSKSYATTVKNNATNFRIKFRLRGLPEGGSFLIRVYGMNDLNTALKTYTYTENGIHEFVYNDPNKPARIILYNGNALSNTSEFYLDIIPEYEGYLVTDGVDDKIQSSNFELGKDFTIVGEWEFLNSSAVSAGITKENSLRVFDFENRLVLYLNSTSERTAYYVRSLNAICSDGRIYDNNWTEYQHEGDQSVESSNDALKIGYLDTYFDKLAFKNFAIYPTVLSKNDCIKAYNYLQTLKAK